MLVATVGAATTAVAGCLGGADSPDHVGDGTGELGDPTHSAEVVLAGETNHGHSKGYISLRFEPGVVHIIPGGTVRWEVEGHEDVDHHQHSIAAYHPDTHGPQRIPDAAEPWESATLDQGDAYEHTFEQEGIYDYLDSRRLCLSHEVLGAVGRVVVGWPDPDSEPASQHNVGRLPSQAESTLTAIDDRTDEILSGE